MIEPFIGRENERNILKQCYNSETCELVAVYGRRRVGKTYLIKTEFGNSFDFYFTGMYKVPLNIQLSNFFLELQDRSNNMFEKAPKTWTEAFDLLKKYLISLNKEKVLVFLDELPWMDTPKSNFISSFSYFYNTWLSLTSVLKIFVCGSASTWIVNKLIGDKGGLYGRTTRNIYLAPFTLKETKTYLNEIKKCDYSDEQVLETYMYVGGIPYYLSMFNPKISIVENINILFFKHNASLNNEFNYIFRSLFNESESYKKVIIALSKTSSGMSREDISFETKILGGTLTRILSDLELCDFIRSFKDYDKKNKNKKYQLIDLYSLFYLKIVDKKTNDDNYWINIYNKPVYNAWKGYTLEIAVMNNISNLKKTLGISGIVTNACSWRKNGYIDKDGTEWKGGQIDLLIDREDKVINLIEIKYSDGEYIISKDYSETIKNRMETFKKTTNTKKALRCTFVTIYGVKKNMYSNIVQDDIRILDFFN